MDINRSSFPLTNNQQQLWNIEMFFPKTKINNITVSGFLCGEVDYEILNSIVHSLIEKNEGLRIKFMNDDHNTRQYVGEYTESKLELIDFSHFEHPENEFNTFISHFANKPFSLVHEFLFEFVLINVTKQKQGIVYRVHHLISDGYSVSNLMNSIWTAYENVKAHGYDSWQASLVENMSYLSYLDKEAAYMESKRYLKDREFWHNNFSTKLPELIEWKNEDIPPTISPLQAGRISYTYHLNISEQIKSFVKLNQTSINTFFVAITYVAVMKLYQKDDIALGIPVMNRSGKKEKESFGMYASTVPYRIHKPDPVTFQSLVKTISRDLTKIFFHQKYSYDLLLKDLSSSLNGMEGLLQISVNYYNNPLKKTVGSIPLEFDSYSSGEQHHPLNIIIKEVCFDGEITLNFDYRKDVIAQRDIELLNVTFQRLVEQVIKDPSIPLSQLEIVTNEQREQLIAFNNQNFLLPEHEMSIQRKFEIYAEQNPEQEALAYNGNVVTYAELNERSNQLARMLMERGVGRNHIVALVLEKSMEAIIAVLSIIKAGGAFLPIDPMLPAKRIQFMLDDSQSNYLITTDKKYVPSKFKGCIVYLDDTKLKLFDKHNVEVQYLPNDLAYIIYTSGTTGVPKGVMLEHHGLNHLGVFAKKYFNLGREDRIIQFASISFDSFVWEILTSVLSGASLYIPTPEILNNYNMFEEYLNENEITFATLPPAYLNYINPDNVHALKTLITVGETINRNLMELWRKKVDYYNGYGPTEATICTTLWKGGGQGEIGAQVPIGKPADHINVYIVDKYNCLVPVGIPGELCISGNGLARGYLNHSELTAKRFEINPFRPQERMYKTGDMAKWLPNGNIEFLGRIDNQVKLRGFRVELGEIESALLLHKLVREAAVIVDNRNENIHILCAYYVSEKWIDTGELRTFLEQKLPHYMIPTYFIKLPEKLPVNINGKVDRKALPHPSQYIKANLKKPASETEFYIANLWAAVLGLEVDDLSVDQNFFDIGGNSLLIIDICTKLEQKFNVKINISDLFVYGTIQKQSDWILERLKEQNGQLLKCTSLEGNFFNSDGAGAITICKAENRDNAEEAAMMLAAWILTFTNRKQKEITVHYAFEMDIPRILTVCINEESTLENVAALVRLQMGRDLALANRDELKIAKRIINQKKCIIPALFLNASNVEQYYSVYDLVMEITVTPSGMSYKLVCSEVLNKQIAKGLLERYMNILAHLSTIRTY